MWTDTSGYEWKTSEDNMRRKRKDLTKIMQWGFATMPRFVNHWDNFECKNPFRLSGQNRWRNKSLHIPHGYYDKKKMFTVAEKYSKFWNENMTVRALRYAIMFSWADWFHIVVLCGSVNVFICTLEPNCGETD